MFVGMYGMYDMILWQPGCILCIESTIDLSTHMKCLLVLNSIIFKYTLHTCQEHANTNYKTC